MFFSKQMPFRTNTPSSNTFNSCFKKGGRCDQMSFLSETHWGAVNHIFFSCAHLTPSCQWIPSLIKLVSAFRDLTFLNYTQSSCVTVLVSVCLPSVLPFQMQTCVTVYPLCVTSLLQQIQSSGNQVKVKFISGCFVPLHFTVCHMLIIGILN